MADFNSAVMTNEGAALLAQCQAGVAKMQFTAMVTGNGEYTEEEKRRESLIHQPNGSQPLLSINHARFLATRLTFAHGQYNVTKEIVILLVESSHNVFVKLLTLVLTPAIGSLVGRYDVLLTPREKGEQAELMCDQL